MPEVNYRDEKREKKTFLRTLAVSFNFYFIFAPILTSCDLMSEIVILCQVIPRVGSDWGPSLPSVSSRHAKGIM